MRITTRLSTAGEAGFLSMPALRHPAEHYAVDGRLDEGRVRRELDGTPGVQISSDDGRDTLSFAVELLDRMRVAMERHMQTNSGTTRVDTTGHGTPPAQRTTAQRRFDRGKLTFVRLDIRRNGQVPGFRVKLSATNPRNVVGRSEEFARIYAQAFADNVVAIADSLKEESGLVVDMQEGEGCEGVFVRARERNDLQAARLRHVTCPNRTGGYCSPCVPTCALYKDGRCLYNN
jgi:hypothetical protein